MQAAEGPVCALVRVRRRGESHPSAALHEAYALIERRAARKREDSIDTTRGKCAEVINQTVGPGVNQAIGT
jgi:hypothetical protein